jgi:hypothetical protein
MVETRTQNILRCDCCNREITIPTVFLNDGSFQYYHVTLHGKDICNICTTEFLGKLDNEINIEKEVVDKVLADMGSLMDKAMRNVGASLVIGDMYD